MSNSHVNTCTNYVADVTHICATSVHESFHSTTSLFFGLQALLIQVQRMTPKRP